jgi:hypothetical protein
MNQDDRHVVPEDLAPQVHAQSAPNAERQPAEKWSELKNTEPWIFAAAKAEHRWPHGCELTEAEYLEAVKRSAHGAIR